MKNDEVVLLYGFKTDENFEKITEVLKSIHIKVKVLNASDYNEKLGFLLGMKGFNKANENEENILENELMIFQNIKGKRLDLVLDSLRGKECKIPKYKAVVTPFNVHWTLKKLYEQMKKEHGSLK